MGSRYRARRASPCCPGTPRSGSRARREIARRELSTLYNCAVTGNDGGGVGSDWNGVDSTVFNSIVYGNTNGNYTQGTILNYCLTTPMPTNGVGNITNAPLFVDYAGGNLHLQPNSPCINAGLNAYAPGPTDLDGLPRIVGGTVDMGAYEFQTPASQISYAWLQQFGLPTDGSADFTDLDADRMNICQEWQADTNPTNSLSCLAVEAITHGPPVSVTFQSSATRLYTLFSCATLTGAVWTPVPGQTDIPGTGAQQTLTDPAPGPSRFYRVGVRLP